MSNNTINNEAIKVLTLLLITISAAVAYLVGMLEGKLSWREIMICIAGSISIFLEFMYMVKN